MPLSDFFSCQGNLPMPYLVSVIDVYEVVLQKSPNYSSGATNKVKQEVLHGLGNAVNNLIDMTLTIDTIFRTPNKEPCFRYAYVFLIS